MKDAAPSHEEKLTGNSLAFYQACQGLVERGFSVFPCRQNKAPFTPSGYKDASRDLNEAYIWAQDHPDAQPAIACEASGLVVIDVDDLEAFEAFLERRGYSVPDTLSASTPSGGRHFYFFAPAGFHPPARLCDGVDIKYKGYVLAPPAQAFSKRANALGHYEWQNEDASVAPMPEWPELTMASPVPETAKGGAHVVKGAFAEMQALLSHIPADITYPDWVQVLASVYEETSGSNEGLSIADEWSATGSKYKAGEVDLKWRSFVLGKAGGMSTLAHFAREHGADLSAIARSHSDLSHLCNELDGVGDIDVSGLLAGHVDTTSKPEAAATSVQATDPDALVQHRVDSLSKSIIRGDAATPLLDQDYLIKGWFGHGDLSTLYGPSNVGKSFVALDIANHVAKSSEWNGCKVRGGTAIYFAAEGGRSLQNRLVALRGGASKDLILVPEPVDLFASSLDVQAIVKLAQEQCSGPIAMIVFDTLARSMPGGDENSGTDMGRVVRHLDYIRSATGAHVMVVHHTGKDHDRGSRGHSSLPAAVDTELACHKKDGIRTLITTKQRDMETGKELAFDLVPYVLGHDEDGEEKSTCYVEFRSVSSGAGRPKVQGKNQKLLLRLAKKFIVENGAPLSAPTDDETILLGVDRDDLFTYATIEMQRSSGKATNRAVSEAFRELVKRGELIEIDDKVSLPAKNEKPVS